MATAGAWEKHYLGQVRCLPPPAPHQSVRVSCGLPCVQQALTTRESKTVDVGTASGKATTGAWEKEYKGEVRCLPPPPHQSVRVSC